LGVSYLEHPILFPISYKSSYRFLANFDTIHLNLELAVLALARIMRADIRVQIQQNLINTKDQNPNQFFNQINIQISFFTESKKQKYYTNQYVQLLQSQ